MSHHDYWPGDRLACLAPHGLILLPLEVNADVRLLLWEQFSQRAGLHDLLATLTGLYGFRDLPEFAIALDHGGRLELVLRGDLEAMVITEHDEQSMAGTGVLTWAERVFAGASEVSVRVTRDAGVESAAGPLPIGAGVVLASRVRLLPAGPDESAGEPHVAAIPLQGNGSEPTRSVPTAAPLEHPEPVPEEVVHTWLPEETGLAQAVDQTPVEADPSLESQAPAEPGEGDPQDQVDLRSATPPQAGRYAAMWGDTGLDLGAEFASLRTEVPAAAPPPEPEPEPELAPEQVPTPDVHPDPAADAGTDREPPPDGTQAGADSADSELAGPEPAAPPPIVPEHDGPQADPPGIEAEQAASPAPAGFFISEVPGRSTAPVQQSAAEPAGPQGDHDGLTLLPEQWRALSQEVPQDSALPPDSDAELVLAVACSQGHANPPHSESCRRCGQSLSGAPEQLPRPALARLRFSDGQVIDLTRTVVIGRMPGVSRVPAGRMPLLHRVSSPRQEVSRSHLEIRVEGWSVLGVDLRSSNGTMLRRPGQDPLRLSEHDPQPLHCGDSLNLGDGVDLVIEEPM